MNDVSQHQLELPGGSLYYEVRGAGPLLLVIGQPMTSGPFGPLADLLASDHTVVTYDPHGVGLSTVTDPSLPVTPEVEADDLAAIIDALGGGPADVFGTSGGAVAGLALTAAYPEKVGTLVAHEPPVAELLPDAIHIRATLDRIESAYLAGGSGAAWGAFVGLVMHQGEITEAGPDAPSWPPPGPEAEAADSGPAQAPEPPSAKQVADDELFFLRMLKPFTRYRPVVDVLTAPGSPRVVVAIGTDSGPDVARRSTEVLAAQLGVEPIRFPGNHAGFMADPGGFAEIIRQVLDA